MTVEKWKEIIETRDKLIQNNNATAAEFLVLFQSFRSLISSFVQEQESIIRDGKKLQVFVRLKKLDHKGKVNLAVDREYPGLISLQYGGCCVDYMFDRIFHSETTQDDVFSQIQDHLAKSMNGHVSVICYGRSGSGKSYTLIGKKHDRGILLRACDFLLAKLTLGQYLSVKCMEYVSMGRFVDLSIGNVRNCKYSGIIGTKYNATEVKRLKATLLQMINQRKSASTKIHDSSSRCSLIVQFEICDRDQKVIGSLNFVDPAGIEAATMRDSKSINFQYDNLAKELKSVLAAVEPTPNAHGLTTGACCLSEESIRQRFKLGTIVMCLTLNPEDDPRQLKASLDQSRSFLEDDIARIQRRSHYTCN